MPSRTLRVKTVTFTWAQEVLWSTLWRRWTMSPFTAKRLRANAYRPSDPCPAPSITCAWRGPRPVRTAAVSRQRPSRSRRRPFRNPKCRIGQIWQGGRKQKSGSEGAGRWRKAVEGARFMKRCYCCSSLWGRGPEGGRDPAPGCLPAILLSL